MSSSVSDIRENDIDSASLLLEECTDNEPLLSDFDNINDEPHATQRSHITLDGIVFLLGQVTSLFSSIFSAIVPSFIPRWGSSANESNPVRHDTDTAYLDGLRGVAALIVYIVHFVVNWFPALRNAYGTSETDHYLLQLPIIRVICSGIPAVFTFYLVSGYALSYSALKKIHNGTKAQILDSLSSSVFRRCLRIYMPCTVNTFICMLLGYFQMFTHDPLGWNTIPPHILPFSAQLKNWWWNQVDLMYPLRFVEGAPYSPPYNGHLWTIPLEIRGSFVVYGTVLAVARLSANFRTALLAALTSYLWYFGKWDLVLFISGVLLADIDVRRRTAATTKYTNPDLDNWPMEQGTTICFSISDTPVIEDSKLLRLKNHIIPRLISKINIFAGQAYETFGSLFLTILFFASMYLLSVPCVPWGTDFLLSLTPVFWSQLHPFYGREAAAWIVIGCFLLCVSLGLSAPSKDTSIDEGKKRTCRYQYFWSCDYNLQALFTNRFAQYLGRISFGLYVMHGPVLFCIGTKLLVAAWNEYTTEANLGRYSRRFIVAVVINTPLTFWVADIFARVVDERSVRWAKVVSEWMGKKIRAEQVGN